jgi:hypothetical protein
MILHVRHLTEGAAAGQMGFSERLRNIDTWEYLQDIFTRLPAATNQQIAEFTPARWKELRGAPKAS